MENRLQTFMFALLLCCSLQTLRASTPALATWPLVTSGSSVSTASTSGQITATSEILSGLIYGSGATVTMGSPSLIMQRVKYNGTWPAESAYNSTRYVQFSATAKTGSIFAVDSIAATIGSSGGTVNLHADIYYSTDSTFATANVHFLSTNLLGNATYVRVKSTISSLSLNPGQTVYVRIYPWDKAAESGKYLTMYNVVIGGSTTPVPVSSSIIWPCISDITSSVTTGTLMSGRTTALSNLIDYGSETYGSTAGQSLYTGTAWALETAPVEGRYVQFAAAPKSGGVLVVDSVRLKLAGFSSGAFNVSVYYSNDSTFTLSTGTKLGNNISVTNGAFSLTSLALSSKDTIQSGQIMYLRLYPYYTASGADQWKLLALDSVSVYGRVTGVTADPPTITTTAVSSISTTFATTGGTISSDGGATVTDRGIVYSTTDTTPTTSDTKAATGTGSGSFTTQLTGLTAGTTYYTRAYATNSAGTSYGSVVTFTTLAALVVPSLTTTSVSSILAKTAISGGNVSAWGGSNVTTCGICWSATHSTPTIADSTCSNGSGTGSFSCSLSQLLPSTTYYVCAYATNSTGTGYGSVVSFTTQAVAPDVIKTVGKDANSNYNTIQAAFSAVPSNYTGRWIIYVKNGTYFEKCQLTSTQPNVYLIGQNIDSCIITYNNYAGIPSGSGTIGTTNSYSVAIDASDFYAQNITFQNTIQNTGKNTYSSGGDQAVALRTEGDRQQYYNCRLLGYQDTYYTNSTGRIYMKDCYIAGSVDFIFGDGTMILDSCTTYCNRTGGVNCAPNTLATSSFGYVFRNCTLTSLAAGALDFNGTAFVNYYLGRPWQNNPKAVYITCSEPATINPLGWTTMTSGLNPFFAEYNCTGPGSAFSGRCTTSTSGYDFAGQQLTSTQAATYTTSNIFSKNTNSSFSYNWLPSPMTDIIDTITIVIPTNGTLTVSNGTTQLQSKDAFPKGASLTVTGWTGTISGGTNGQIFVGKSGLTTAQLALINFSGYSGGAVLLSTGEIVPEAVGSFQSQASGNWNSTATWLSSNNTTSTAAPTSSAASVTISNGTAVTIGANATASALTINEGGELTLTSGYTLSTTNFTINSDNTNGTGTFVDQNTTGGFTVTGTTNVNQYLTSGRAWYISSPVSGATSNVISASASNPLYSYAEPTNTWTSIINTTTSLGVMTGYVANITSSGTVTFTGGTLNTGAKSIGLTFTSGAEKQGFNMIGNPYPSYLDCTAALASINTANMEPTIWYRTQNTSNAYVFDTYNTTSSLGTGNNGVAEVTQYVAPMQAFWVRVASGNTSGTFAVDNTMRSHQSQSVSSGNRLKAVAHHDVASAGSQSTEGKLLTSSGSSTTTQSVLRLKVSNGVNSDEAIVLFNPNASNGYDSYDSPKMSNNNAAIPEIYTLAGGQQVVINGLNSIDTVTALPLGFTTGTNNTFTIMANEVSNFDSGIRILLNDNLQNTSTDLTGGAVYTFSSDVVSTTSRFSISFKTLTEVASGINTTTSPSISIFRSGNDQITVAHSSENGQEGEISIYSSLGQKVLVTPTTGETTVINAPFSPGIYIVSVKIEGKLTTKKVVID